MSQKIITTSLWSGCRKKLSPGAVSCLIQFSGEMASFEALTRKIDELYAIRTHCIILKKTVRIPGITILQLRKGLFLSQAKFGRIIGISRVSVSHWEHSRTEPTTKTCQKILHLLDHAVADFQKLVETPDTGHRESKPAVRSTAAKK